MRSEQQGFSYRQLPLPQTVPDGVEVWSLALDLQAPLSPADLAVFDASERERIACLHFHKDRVRAVATRAALRRLLAGRLMTVPEALHFSVNEYGKPALQGEAGIEFNVSHAGCFAMIALSNNGRIGVDIEYQHEEIDANNLSRYILSPLEYRPAGMTQVEFIRHWVAKESVLKALGLGISEHLQSVSILPDGNADYQVICDYPEWPELKVWPIEAPANYSAALAMECRVQPHEKALNLEAAADRSSASGDSGG